MSAITIDINELRSASRHLLREWGILKFNAHDKLSASQAHALLEISNGADSMTRLSDALVLDVSTVSRLVEKLVTMALVTMSQAKDKRVKSLALTPSGEAEVVRIDEFSNKLIEDAFETLTPQRQKMIYQGVSAYAHALEESRLALDQLQIRTLRKDKLLRQQICDMIYMIQRNEFEANVEPSINDSIMYAESAYYFGGKCNFWYAVDKDNRVVGCIGLKYVNDDCAELKKCFVVPEFRGKGLANQLVSKLISQARKLAIKRIYLGTVDYFTWAHKFYQKFGFKKIDLAELPEAFERCSADSVFFCGDVATLTTKN